MIRPDALPITPVGSRATLLPSDAAHLFGRALRGGERVEVTAFGRRLCLAPATAGSVTALTLSALDTPEPGTAALRLSGPTGHVSAPHPETPEPRLVLPAALRRAWRLSEPVTVQAGFLVLSLPVVEGQAAAVEIDRALWLGAGRPETSRVLPDVSIPSSTGQPSDTASPSDSKTSTREVATREVATREVAGRVVTETHVRQARLHGQRIRLRPDQVVTPAAATLARDAAVFLPTD